jgi:hypothetical protein
MIFPTPTIGTTMNVERNKYQPTQDQELIAEPHAYGKLLHASHTSSPT